MRNADADEFIQKYIGEIAKMKLHAHDSNDLRNGITIADPEPSRKICTRPMVKLGSEVNLSTRCTGQSTKDVGLNIDILTSFQLNVDGCRKCQLCQ